MVVAEDLEDAQASSATVMDEKDITADLAGIDLREEAGRDYAVDRKKTSDLPLKAQILLGPIHKYRLMGVFPWPFLIHVLLVIADSYWIVYMSHMNAAFISQQKMAWYLKFSNPDIARDDYGYERRRTFDTVDAM